jgi:carbonic anhydrase
VHEKHETAVAALPTEAARADRLCELNVIEQVRHLCETTVVQEAWERGQPLSVHGWIYGLQDGRLRDLGVSVSAAEALSRTYRTAVSMLA